MRYIKISLFSIIITNSCNLYSVEKEPTFSPDSTEKSTQYEQLSTGENILKYEIKDRIMLIQTGSRKIVGKIDLWKSIQKDGTFYYISNDSLISSLNDFYNKKINSNKNNTDLKTINLQNDTILNEK